MSFATHIPGYSGDIRLAQATLFIGPQYSGDSGAFVSGNHPDIYPCGGLTRKRYGEPLGSTLVTLPPGRLQGTQGKIDCLFTMAVCSDIGKYLSGSGVVCVRLVVYLMK